MHYGYSDGSGEYYIVIDAAKCDGCRKCVAQCPQAALEIVTVLVDLDDKTVAAVTEQHRKSIKYTCASCKPKARKHLCSIMHAKSYNVFWHPR